MTKIESLQENPTKKHQVKKKTHLGLYTYVSTKNEQLISHFTVGRYMERFKEC